MITRKVRLALINLFIPFPSDLLELYCQEFDNTLLLMGKIYTNDTTNMAIQES